MTSAAFEATNLRTTIAAMQPALGRLPRALRALAIVAAFAGCRAPNAPAPAPAPAPFDLVLRSVTLLDGSGAPGRPGDLAIRDGRIEALGTFDVPAGSPMLYLDGLVVAPGFVDVHTHVDAELVRQPGAENFLRMGVTTLVTGNCGSSVENLGAHFARLERGGIGPNYASLVGHGTVRRAVLGTENRAPTTAELARMQELVAAAMREGAFGMSTGLIYVPGTYAATDELIALAKVVGRTAASTRATSATRTTRCSTRSPKRCASANRPACRCRSAT
jgi:N-acyl-D-aspartate/D-glutamate deacylase